MFRDIFEFLLRRKTVVFPGMGEFIVTAHPAVCQLEGKDVPMLKETIQLTETNQQEWSEEMISWIAGKQNKTMVQVENMLSDMLTSLQHHLTIKSFAWKGVGILYKASNGTYALRPDLLITEWPVYEEEQTVAVMQRPTKQEEESGSIVEEMYDEEEKKRGAKWWLWAGMLAIVIILALIYHFSNTATSGNTTKVVPKIAQPTYR